MNDAAAVTGAEAGRIAETLAEIACAAGTVLRHWHGGDCPHVLKPDGSPASAADLESEALILKALTTRFPGIPIVAEESSGDRAAGDLFFLVDPLDGTRDFLAGTPHYSVNIALVSEGRPIAAALAAPGLDRVWFSGHDAFEAPIIDGRPGAAQPVRARKAPEAGLLALGSRRHGDAETTACLATLPVMEVRTSGSALKFGLIAAGEADIYVRCGPPWNGTRRRATRSSRRPGAASSLPRAGRSATDASRTAIATAPSRPSATRRSRTTSS